MVTYDETKKHAFFKGRMYTKDERTGYYLCSTKNDLGIKERLHVAVWENAYGKVPKGMHVHHVDFDKSNNSLSNLVLLSAKEHSALHGRVLDDKHRELRRKNLLINAVPASKAWHASEEGKAWHSIHGKQTWETRQEKEYTCSNCGQTFKSQNAYGKHGNRFCSNKCRSSFRRKSGVDNESRICAVCGKIFFTGKYTKTKTCSLECGHKVRSLLRSC